MIRTDTSHPGVCQAFSLLLSPPSINALYQLQVETKGMQHQWHAITHFVWIWMETDIKMVLYHQKCVGLHATYYLCTSITSLNRRWFGIG